MSVKLNYNNVMFAKVGEHGIKKEELEQMRQLAKQARAKVEASRGEDMQGWMDSPYNQAEAVGRIVETAAKIRNECENFVVLGIGGSALGAIAVFNALKHLYYNELPREMRKGPRFYVIDNVDPERMNALFDIIDVSKTVFNVITKSGATSETMSQYLIITDLLKRKLGDKASRHIVATTSSDKGNLVKLAKENGFETFYIPDGVGGRFSVLSPVGLLPAAVLGIDISELLRGARETDELCKSDDLNVNPALTMAVIQYLLINKGCNINVMMPYADSLKYVADWYAQLWAESLGKERDLDGNTVNAGQTPVKALGVTDQHSQVQLYNEGPFDKVITFLEVNSFRSDIVIPQGCDGFSDVNFLCGHTLAELTNKELYATRYNLTKRGRVNFTLSLDSLDEYHLGSLIYLLQLCTAYEGALLNVNAYNQPGVEGGKDATYALFGRNGYESKAEEMNNAPQDSAEFIV